MRTTKILRPEAAQIENWVAISEKDPTSYSEFKDGEMSFCFPSMGSRFVCPINAVYAVIDEINIDLPKRFGK